MQVVKRETRLEYRDGCWQGSFTAMASPCQLMVDGCDESLATSLLQMVAKEAWRIETSYSRYREDNIIHKLNNANGEAIELDDEACRLIEFADQLFELSDGLFDITSGVLRRVWRFDGSNNIPRQSAIDKILPSIGWQKVRWQSPWLTIPSGMQIDFGGIGKEYAVDRAAGLVAKACQNNFLINFGGDMFVSGPRQNGRAWRTGIENPDMLGEALGVLDIYKGALATSGDSRRYLMKKGVRYSHVLNPKTGWPVKNAPHSITVASSNCVEAGMLSTLSLLQGENAEKFLQEQNVEYWCIR